VLQAEYTNRQPYGIDRGLYYLPELKATFWIRQLRQASEACGALKPEDHDFIVSTEPLGESDDTGRFVERSECMTTAAYAYPKAVLSQLGWLQVVSSDSA
jgi:hypothetical protein